MICALLRLASAAEVHIDAVVDPDLAHVRGTMSISHDLLVLVDPLALLPDPGDDLQLQRTFPQAPDHGRIRWEDAGDGRYTFETRLPHRFGDVGATRFGLFANGAWYPQPLTGDGLPEVSWTVTVTLPEGATGALGDVLGDGTLRWSGTADRASLAVVRRGHLTPLDARLHDVTLLTRGRPRRWLVRELEAQLALLPMSLDGSVVEAPMRRRLVRDGPGLAYVSDRAFRLTAGLRFVHRRAVARGLAAALVEVPDPFERDVAGAALGQAHAEALEGLETDRLLGAFRWVPQVNALLSSERTPFFAEILDRTHPGDPVRDDLVEILDPHTPGTAVVTQLDVRYGAGTGRCVGEAYASGDDPRPCDVDLDWLDGWRREYPRLQDYTLELGEDRVTITRLDHGDAQPEALVVRIDGEDHVLLADGLEVLEVDTPPRGVALDPERHVEQRSRSGDTLPPRYDVTLSGWLDSINVSQRLVFGSAWATLRRWYDTHNLVIGSVSNSRSDLVGVDLAWLRKEGPLQDGWSRPHRLRTSIGASVLNPGFAETDGLAVALDGAFSWAHDTRVSGDFPVRGHRVGFGVGGGLVPGEDTWVSLSADALGIASFHPRHAVAARAAAAVARSSLPHRLLPLGSPGAMRSIPALPACPSDGPCTELATERAVAMAEYRWAPIRGWSVPGLLAWGSELQLAGGFEATAARVGGEPVWATGVTAGIYGLADVLGAEPTGAGVTLAWPLVLDERLVELERTAAPEIYLRFAQAF